jgi:hypothetical protein
MTPGTSFLNKKAWHIIISLMACIFISLAVIWELVLPLLLGCKDNKVKDPDLLITL